LTALLGALGQARQSIATISAVKLADAAMAAVGLVCSLGSLHALDRAELLSPLLSCFSPPMLSSAIILFAGPTPPPLGTFVVGTAGAFLMGTTVHLMLVSAIAGSTGAQCLAAGLLLFYFKVSGAFFVPTVGLAAHLAQGRMGQAQGHMAQAQGHLAQGHWTPAHAGGHGGRSHLDFPPTLGYLLAPWLLGHLALYALAHVTSAGRQQLRLALLPDWKRQLLGGSGASRHAREAKLRETFSRFDTSGDGFLDATELKLALRFVTGEEVSLEDCERIVRSMDTDGDGVIDFHEFQTALAER